MQYRYVVYITYFWFSHTSLTCEHGHTHPIGYKLSKSCHFYSSFTPVSVWITYFTCNVLAPVFVSPPRFLLPCIRSTVCFQSSTPSGRISMAFSAVTFPAQGSVHSTAASTQQHTSKVKSLNVRISALMLLVNPGLYGAKPAKIKRDHRLGSLVNSSIEMP